MDTLLNTNFVFYIKEHFVDEKEGMNIDTLYKDFVRQLFDFCTSQQQNSQIFLILNYVRIEFESIKKETQYHQKKIMKFITLIKLFKY